MATSPIYDPQTGQLKPVPSVLPQAAGSPPPAPVTPAPASGIIGNAIAAAPAAPRTAANNWNDADIQSGAKELYGALQGMTANGDEAGAKALYKEKQGLYGFTDDQFSSIAKGANGTPYSAQQIGEWKANPGTSAAKTPAPAGVVASAMAAPVTNTYNAGTPQTASASGWAVGDDQLVEKRAANIAKSDSELMQLARSRAEQQANSRGLINSSMAVGAGQTAVLDKAIEIGSRDASTLAQSAQFNADSANKASMFNAGQANQWNMNTEDRNFTGRENAMDRSFKEEQSDKDKSWQSGENVLDRNFKSEEANVDRGWRSGERVAGEQFQSGENTKQREFSSSEAGKGRDFQAEQAGVDRAWKSGESSADRSARVDEYKFNAQTQKEVKEMDFKYQKQLNADNDTAKMYGAYVDEMYKIDTDPNMDAPAKEALKRTARQKFEGFAKIRGLDLKLDFSLEAGGGDSAISAQTQGNFDEAAYMAANPDLAQSGWDRGGWDHYQRYGKNEGRSFAAK